MLMSMTAISDNKNGYKEIWEKTEWIMGTGDHKFPNKSDIRRKWSFFLVSEQLAVLMLIVTYKLIIHSMDWYTAYGHYFTWHLPLVNHFLLICSI